MHHSIIVSDTLLRVGFEDRAGEFPIRKTYKSLGASSHRASPDHP